MGSRCVAAVWLVGFAFASACDDGDDAAGEPIPVGLGLEVARTVCERRTACCQEPDLAALYGGRVDDGPSCRLAESAYLEGFYFPAVRASVAAGRVAFHTTRFRACLADLARGTCTDGPIETLTWKRLFLGCGDAIEPRVDDGAACRWSFECRSGVCRIDPDALEGVCVPVPGLDEPCPQRRCADELYCEPAGEACRPRLPDGASCRLQDECEGGGCLAGACASICRGGGPGDDGSAPIPVELGVELVDAECGTASRCCGAGEPFRSYPDEMACRLDIALEMTRFLPPRHRSVRSGSAWVEPDQLALCRDNLRALACLDYARAVPLFIDLPPCAAWLQGAVECVTSEECFGSSCGYTADFSRTVCVPLAAVGSSCATIVHCVAGASCEAGVCVPSTTLGDACYGDGDCVEGSCAGDDPSTFSPGTCALECAGGMP